MSLESELKTLFDPETVHEAMALPVTPVSESQARKVSIFADILHRHARYPQRQRALIASLPAHDRLLLCRWLADLTYTGKLVSTC